MTLTALDTRPGSVTAGRPTLRELQQEYFLAPARSVRRWLWDQQIDWGTPVRLGSMLLISGGLGFWALATTHNLTLAMLIAWGTFGVFAFVEMIAGSWLDEHLFNNRRVPRWRIKFSEKPGKPTVLRYIDRTPEQAQALLAKDIERTFGVIIADPHLLTLSDDARFASRHQVLHPVTGTEMTVVVSFASDDSPAHVETEQTPRPVAVATRRLRGWFTAR
jgi:hypothetical protein